MLKAIYKIIYKSPTPLSQQNIDTRHFLKLLCDWNEFYIVREEMKDLMLTYVHKSSRQEMYDRLK